MTAMSAVYMRAWRLKNSEKFNQYNRKYARKAMKRRYDYEKMCKIFRQIEWWWARIGNLKT